MTSYKKILILNSKEDVKLEELDDNIHYYSINSGFLLNNNSVNLNSQKYFHLTALNIKNEYIDIIADISKYIENDFKDLNYNIFYLTDLSTKRTEYFKNFDYICHILLIKKILSKENYSQIIFYNVPNEFISTINNFSKINSIILKKKKINYINFFNYLFSQLLFIYKLIIIKLLLKLFKTNYEINKENNKYYFSTYPKNFINGKHIKYGSFTNNKSFYILTLITDNIHQNFKILSFLSKIKEIKKYFLNNYIITDNYLKFTDIIFFIRFNFYYFDYVNKKIINHQIRDIDFSLILKKNLKDSFLRLSRIVTLKLSYNRLSYKINHNCLFYYYLFEYPYGRMLNLSFNQINIKKIGFQHGPTGYLKMICFLSKKDINSTLNNFLPDEIIAEDENSYKIYKDGNFKNISIMKSIYRLKYLDKLNKNNEKSNTHLIACGLHDGFILLKSLLKQIHINKNIKYIVKLHPKATNKKLIYFINNSEYRNLVIASKKIEYYIENVDKIYFTYTSIGQEAEYLGIDFEVIFSHYKLNESIYCTKERLQSI